MLQVQTGFGLGLQGTAMSASYPIPGLTKFPRLFCEFEDGFGGDRIEVSVHHRDIISLRAERQKCGEAP